MNNTSTTANDSTVKPLQEKHDSIKEYSVSDHNNVQSIPLVDPQPNGATKMGEGRNFQDGEKSKAQLDTNMNTRSHAQQPHQMTHILQVFPLVLKVDHHI